MVVYLLRLKFNVFFVSRCCCCYFGDGVRICFFGVQCVSFFFFGRGKYIVDLLFFMEVIVVLIFCKGGLFLGVSEFVSQFWFRVVLWSFFVRFYFYN